MFDIILSGSKIIICGVMNLEFKRIRDMREDHDKFQKDIAKYLGISQQYYSEYETGNRTITIEYLIKLAKLYNTSIDYLVELTDEIKPYNKHNNQKRDII